MSKFDIKNFKPGLIIEKNKRPVLSSSLPNSYRNPLHVDRRYELLPSSFQGQTSECVAYSVAGLIEGYNWVEKDIYSQIDPSPIYKEAKKIDGISQEGTTLEAGLEAAERLGLITNIEQSSIRAIDKLEEIKRALFKKRFLIGCFNATAGWGGIGSDGFIKESDIQIGGHAVLLCGYSEITKNPKTGKILPFIIFQNSWQNGWFGFNRISYDLFLKDFYYALTFDFK